MEISGLDRFENGLARVEKGLNYVAIVPFLAGTARIILGKLQVITAIAAGVIFGLASLFAQGHRKQYLQEMASRSLIHVVHGLANIARGVVEYFPLGGPAMILIYDKGLSQRIGYKNEINESYSHKRPGFDNLVRV